MTTLYAVTTKFPESSEVDRSFVSFTTQDDYPHIGSVLPFGDNELQKRPFHILYVEDKHSSASERLIVLLKFRLTQFDFAYITEVPEVMDREVEKISMENINACLVDLDHQVAISTIVKPIK